MDHLRSLEAVVAIVCIILLSTAAALEKTVKHNSILTGNLYFQEIMETENLARFKEVTRMDRDDFEELIRLLRKIWSDFVTFNPVDNPVVWSTGFYSSGFDKKEKSSKSPNGLLEFTNPVDSSAPTQIQLDSNPAASPNGP